MQAEAQVMNNNSLVPPIAFTTLLERPQKPPDLLGNKNLCGSGVEYIDIHRELAINQSLKVYMEYVWRSSCELVSIGLGLRSGLWEWHGYAWQPPMCHDRR